MQGDLLRKSTQTFALIVLIATFVKSLDGYE
jgi:hypothetical protein